MAAIVRMLNELINKIPPRWRSKILLWAATGGIGFLVKLVWGPGVLLGGLIVISFVGWFLYQYGVRQGKHASDLLGNVWDYFRGAILFALLPAVLAALKEILGGDPQAGLIQLLVIALVAAVVFDQFSRLPRSWSALTARNTQRVRITTKARRSGPVPRRRRRPPTTP